MGRFARLGVVLLMGLAIGVARLIEVEFAEGDAPLVVVQPVETATQPLVAPPALSIESLAELDSVAEPPPPASSEQPPRLRTYVVRKGDTLSGISQREYGTTKYWERILQANREVIPNPKRMKEGIRLRIPQ